MKNLELFFCALIVLLILIVGCSQEKASPTVSPSNDSITGEEDADEIDLIVEATEAVEATLVPTDTPIPEVISDTTKQVESNSLELVTPNTVEFTLPGSNQTIPDDIMQEIAYFTAGGGGSNDCEEFLDSLVWNGKGISSVDKSALEVALLGGVEIQSCGWEENETVTTTIIYPDGTEQSETYVYPPQIPQTIIQDFGKLIVREIIETEIIVFFRTLPTDPLGEYTVRFEGTTQKLEISFEVVAPVPEEPIANIDVNENGEWRLYNFLPGETIRVIALSGICPSRLSSNQGTSLKVCGWQEYLVDDNGSLIINTPDIFDLEYTIAIISENSGFFSLSAGLDDVFGKFIGQAKDGFFLGLRETPNFYNDSLISRINPDARFLVVGSTYRDEYHWYNVLFADGVTGWVTANSVIASEQDTASNFSTSFLKSDSEFLNSLNPLVHIPAGKYNMGSGFNATFSEDAERPLHSVELGDYWIQRIEVSNGDYAACVNTGACSEPMKNSSITRQNYYANPEYDNYPVINVSFEQALAYCSWWGGRLPTEAEWEIAARAPFEHYYAWGGIPFEEIGGTPIANFDDITGDTTAVVDIWESVTPLGLFNMHGNVWEWTQDWYDAFYYETSPTENPTGPNDGSEKVVRGGGWSTGIEYLSFTNRFSKNPSQGYNDIGFRCVTTTPQE